MLIEFRFKNFRSFRDETRFLMSNVKSFGEHIEKNIIKTKKEFDLLKTSAIYGSNAGGKSNFISAMAHMAGIVHNSFSNSLKKEEDKPIHDFQFKLNTKTENADTMFEVSFLLVDTIYRYGFQINGHEIKKEWLYKKIEREIVLFSREGGDFDINKSAFNEGIKYKDDVNQNVLFISHLAQNNQIISRIVFNWFLNVNILSGLTEDNYALYTSRLIQKDTQFKNWISLALKFMEIANIEAGEEEGKVVTYHNRFDENNLLINSIPFNVSENESHGTKKLIYLLGPMYDTLRNGRILFIDEFDSKLHPNLTKKLLMLFNEFNIKGAQLVFTGHDSSLLDKNLLRRDQIWFIGKDQFGVSELYSLSEFNAKTVRNTSSYEKKYLENKFGASDTIELNQKLMDFLYGE
ncbi:MAG: ATP-binding protein [Bacteroidales bacterium]|nr:ATP-binding protein [Bacteroidales bacterium]MCF8458766.1 ATP-binding protein [Bacteroidales bacterium]